MLHCPAFGAGFNRLSHLPNPMKRVLPCLFGVGLLLPTLPAAAERPNVVLIIADDQTYRDFGFMGSQEVRTPHLDRLAEQSARFVNGYVPTSVCSPSLAVLLTGKYPHQSGLHYNHPPPGNSAFNRSASRAEYERIRSKAFALIQNQPSLPRTLAKAGYRCLQTGKFWEGHFRNAGFTHGMTTFEPDPEPGALGNRSLPNGDRAAHGNGDLGLRIGREGMQPIADFIGETPADQPFLIWYAPFLPHQPHNSPERYHAPFREAGVAEHRIPYLASIHEFDDTVGQLMDLIETAGRTRDTLFVFVIDNGWTPSTRREKKRPQEFAHDAFSKRSPFEDGLRTPILLRWDGHIRPATHQVLISSVDLVPTILAATVLKGEMGELPGLNLMPAASGTQPLPDRPAFGEIYPGDASSLGQPSRDIAYRWVREGAFKLILTHGEKPWGGYLSGPALFNVEKDPREKENLYDEPAFSEQRRRLSRLVNQWWTPGDDSAVPKP
jgi:uncharacterized sulfatase